MKLGAAWLAALMMWSLIAAPSSVGQSEEPTEPDSVIAYFTQADAAPVLGYFNHEALPAPPCSVNLAHATTDVALPSTASGLAWLTDFGICNGLHGTTTGASVPTETNARQPGGADKGEYIVAGGPIGEEEFGRAAAGVSRATATREGSPRGFAHSYLGNLIIFPAAGSPPQPPGTYDPDATFPGGDQGAGTPDPAPQNQMGILSIGSIASSSESVRNDDTVTSIAVAELQGINIGNRTSDNRCTNCFTIDALRVESFAETNGKPGGARSGYRVMIGRGCRRALQTDPALGGPKEQDTCLPLHELPGGQGTETGGLHAIDTEALNEFFSEPLVLSEAGYTIAIRITAGKPGHVDPTRTDRTPPEDPCRNYAYPDRAPKAKKIAECDALGIPTGPDQDNGQEARAVGEGIDIDILTLTGTQLIPANEDLDSCFGAFDPVPKDFGSPEVNQVAGIIANCPVASLRQVRALNLTLGVASAQAIARPALLGGDTGGEGGDGGGLGGVIPPITPPLGDGTGIGGGGDGGGVQVIGGGGLGAGKYGLKIDWSSLKIKPWAAKDLAKAIFAGAIAVGMVWLIRRRLRQA